MSKVKAFILNASSKTESIRSRKQSIVVRAKEETEIFCGYKKGTRKENVWKLKMKLFFLFTAVIASAPTLADTSFKEAYDPENFNTDNLGFSNNEEAEEYMNYLDSLPVEEWEQFFDNLPM